MISRYKKSYLERKIGQYIFITFYFQFFITFTVTIYNLIYLKV